MPPHLKRVAALPREMGGTSVDSVASGSVFCDNLYMVRPDNTMAANTTHSQLQRLQRQICADECFYSNCGQT